MSVAVVQGCVKGFGQAFTRALLAHTKLHVVGTTASGADQAKQSILSGEHKPAGGHNPSTDTGYGGADNTGGGEKPTQPSNGSKDWEGRLTTLDMDVRDEAAIEKTAAAVKQRFGDNEVRLLVNVSGVLHAEKNLASVSYEKMIETYKINVFGHLLVYKHFTPLLPHRTQTKGDGEDPAMGVVPSGHSTLVSLSARVGSIGDNERGGWYSYRFSKAAINQVIRTLAHEVARKSPDHPALCIAYHPGTLKTGLSEPYTSKQTPENTKGLFYPDQGAENLVQVLRGLKDDMSGGFFAYDGSRIEW